jgi:hypothetical protein
MRALAIVLTLPTFGFGAVWTEHRDPRGFVVKHPPGWAVDTPGKDMMVVHDAGGAAQAIAYGFMTRREVTSRQWIEQQFPSKFGLRFQQARVGAVQQVRGDLATAVVSYSSPSGAGRANLLCSVRGGAGMLFIIAAPAQQFESAKSDLVAILQSFSVLGNGGNGGNGSGGGLGVEWTQWRDPAEGAYTIDAPKGWKIEGGLVRRSTVDVHAWNRFTSPDGQTMILSSDRDIPSYVLPTQTMMQLGTREGTMYNPGYGTQMMVMRYMPGPVYAEMFARKIGGNTIQIKDRRERKDLEQIANRQTANLGAGVASIQNHYGEISFMSGNRAGYVLAGTEIMANTDQRMGGTWLVTFLAGFLCPAGKPQETLAIGEHILNSTRYNPQWVRSQQHTTMQTSAIVTETNEYVSRIRSESYWAQQASHDRTARNFDDTIRGVQRVVDPETGIEYEAVAGKNYYYRVHTTGAVVGTDLTDTPNIDVTLLTQVR